MDIAVLGMGRMGQAVAGRLLAAGHRVTVWNRSPGRTSELVAEGAVDAADPTTAVADVELVITTLANDAAVRNVALGEGGIAAGLRPGAVYADCSTVSPVLTAELARTMSRFVAMPIMGSPEAVRCGDAVYLAGGATSCIDDIEPALASLGTVRRYDEAAVASAAKLAVNLNLLVGVAALAESFAVGRAGGLSDDQLRELLGQSPVVAPSVRLRFEGLLTGKQAAWWSCTLGAKDASLAVDAARRVGVDVPVAAATENRYEEATAAGMAEDDISAIARLYR